MKETVNVNIGSVAFTLDEDAYAVLRRYFDDIRSRLSEEDAETMDDIEVRMAELFRERVASPMRVVTLEVVRGAMARMGAPSEFGERRRAGYSAANACDTSAQSGSDGFDLNRDVNPNGTACVHFGSSSDAFTCSPSGAKSRDMGSGENSTAQSGSDEFDSDSDGISAGATSDASTSAPCRPKGCGPDTSSNQRGTDPGKDTGTSASADANASVPVRRLYRSRKDRLVAGVCGGLAEYLGIDPTPLRLATMLLVLFGGISVWIYIILWIVVPEAPVRKFDLTHRLKR